MLNWRLSEEFNKPEARQTHDVRPVDSAQSGFILTCSVI